MPTPVFEIDDVRKALAASNNSNSCGLVGCPPCIHCKFPELTDSLCDLSNKSIQQRQVNKPGKPLVILIYIKVEVQSLMLRTVNQSASRKFFAKFLER